MEICNHYVFVAIIEFTATTIQQIQLIITRINGKGNQIQSNKVEQEYITILYFAF